MASSLQIQSLDSLYPIGLNTGEGGPGALKHIDGWVTALAGDPAGTIYRLCRVPSNAKIKRLELNSTITNAGQGGVGLYYSDSTRDLTAPANQGAAINTTLFQAAGSLPGSGANVDVTFSGTYAFAMAAVPVWSAAGLSSNPGGMLDICVTVTVPIGGAGILGLAVTYVE